MDPVDEQIVGHLRENGRCSFSDLGRLVGLSTSATAARVRRLETAGIILGYTILTAHDIPGPQGGLELFIDVRLAPDTDGETFLHRVRAIRSIAEAIHVTGPFDYLVRAHVPDTGALDLLLRRLKAECGVTQTQTRVALRAP
ncbi:Lrp/AsnC family transcriptional regulator [Nocardioides sp. BGMRC 2183]|nr:Lrp/AsnC family transcriptional regulator [Nocardioides sp. BGMRC 2183]